MRLPLETIYNAMFNQTCSINNTLPSGQPSLTPFAYMSRRWQHWDQIGDIPMPALFQLEPSDSVSIVRGQRGIQKYEITAFQFIYLAVDSGNLNTPMSPTLNAYFNAVDSAFQSSITGIQGQPQQSGRQQLGLGPGLEECWISNVSFDEGLVAPPAMLVFKIKATCG